MKLQDYKEYWRILRDSIRSEKIKKQKTQYIRNEPMG